MSNATGNATISGLTQALANTIDSRHAAAEVLMRVAEEGSSGHYPSEVSGEMLGAALWRVVLNSHEADALGSILRGWFQAEANWRGQLPSAS
jgi:hypothetical protein